MTRIYTILITGLLLLLIGCTEDYNPVSEETQVQAVIIAEMELGKTVQMVITTTYANDEQPIFPNEDAGNATLSNLVSGQVEKGLRYAETQNIWVQPSFQFKEGHDLQFEADFAVAGMQSITANTTVPMAGHISSNAKASMNGQNEIYLEFQIDNSESSAFYHVIPYVLDTNGERSHLKLQSKIEGLINLSHTNGILIDTHVHEAEYIYSLDLASSLNLNPSDQVYLELRTITEDHFRYHEFLTTYTEAQQGPFSSQIQTYSNVEGGQGIFVAYISNTETLVLQ